MYDTRGAKYVSTRGSGTRYVAVRANDISRDFDRKRYRTVYNVDYRPVRREVRTRYIAVRNIDDDDDDIEYVAVRRVAPRVRYVAVRNVEIDDDDVRYVKLRRSPAVRHVAVRTNDSGCARAVALRSCLDEVETTSVKRVVLRNDDDDDDDRDYSKLVALKDDDDDKEYVLTRDDDDDEYITVANNSPTYVEYRSAAYSDSSYHAPAAMSTRTITYSPVTEEDDIDDQALLHDDSATYVAVADMDDACLTRSSASYVPAAYVESADSDMDGEVTHIVTENSAPRMRYVALDEDRVFDDPDPTYVADDVETETVSYTPVEAIDAEPVSYVPVEEVEMDTDSVSYGPVEAIDAEPVSYVPVEEVDVDTDSVSYVPVETVEAETVSYVPVQDVDVEHETVSYVPVETVNANYVADDACPIAVSSVAARPIYVADTSTVLVEEADADLVAEFSGTRRIAAGFGYRDGFEDGKEAALEGDVFNPENSGDYQKATEGYEDSFGDKDVYKDGYRSSYLEGYRAGFESADRSA